MSEDARPLPERRGSELTPEEVQQGLALRKNALKSPGVDLGSIARTAPALSTSPERPVPVVAGADVRRLRSLLRCWPAVLTLVCCQTNSVKSA